MGSGRLSERNAAIAVMLSDGEQIKNFYRFIAQNPHINLRDASQIIAARPNATVCFTFNEWNAMGRRVTKGRNGIAYYDYDGYKQFVFDANDTHGDSRYQRPILPMKRLLAGLDGLNDTNLADDERSDYRKIKTGVHRYLNEQGELTGDDIRDGLMIEGIAYSLYSKTSFPKSAGIRLSGLPYTYAENAELVKEIYIQTAAFAQEIEDAYDRKQSEVKVIDDVDEETVSDEPVIAERADEDNVKQIVAINSASRSFYKGYVALIKYPNAMLHDFSVSEIYLGKNENYDDHGYYDNTDKSLIFVSNNPKMFSFIRDSHWVVSQQEFIESGDFTEQDYKEFYELKNGLLKSLETTGEILFSVDLDDPNSGVPFRYPNWQEEQIIKQAEQPKVTPLYQRYLDAQKLKPQAVVLMRLGDFYEIMGENAKAVASELDLTLTGRDVGLKERIPMCGIPNHAVDRYLEKILERHGILLVDGDEEPKYILSHEEAAQTRKEPTRPQLIEVDDDEPNPFDSDQSEIDEEDISEEEREEKPKSTPKKQEKGIKERTRKQKPQVSLFDLIEEPKEKSREEAFVDGCLKEAYSDYKVKFYDAYEKNQTVSEIAALMKKEYGESGSYHGNIGITNNAKGTKFEWKDREHPEENISVSLKWNEIAIRVAELIEADDYLTPAEKKEYERVIRYRNERGSAKTDEERCRVIANQIVEYGTQQTYSEMFSEYPHFLEDYVSFYFDHRSEINGILQARDEVVSVKEPRDMFDNGVNVLFRIKYCPRWQERLRNGLRREHRVQDFANSFIESCAKHYTDTNAEKTEWTVTPDDIGERDYLFIKDNRDEFVEYLQNIGGVKNVELTMQRITIAFHSDYILGIANGRVMPPSKRTSIVRDIADKIIKDGTENTTQGNWINSYDDFGENALFARENAEAIADELCRYQEVSDVELTEEGFDTNYYTDYCQNYEEKPEDEFDRYIDQPAPQEVQPPRDLDAEEDEDWDRLIDAGILKPVESTRQTDEHELNRFKELSAEDRSYFEIYTQRYRREPTESPWDEVQSCTTIANGIYSVTTAGHGGIMIADELARHILSPEAVQAGYRDRGYLCYEEDCDRCIPLRELYDKGILTPTNEYFTRCYVRNDKPEAKDEFVPFSTLTEEERREFFKNWSKDLNESLAHWHKGYWQAHEQAESRKANSDGENADLSSVLDQSELGGAKARFKGNVAAIRLVNKLYAENRNPTSEERKILAQFVGWGGLSQAFDEHNASWKKEYAELKNLLSTEDYEQAKSSTLNAYYTAKDVIGGIYSALNRFGVKGNNRILEPSMGTGNFFGFMPKEISDGSRLYGVELDNLTGRIAAKLYPQANVQIKGFEDTTFPNDKFDIVVGNVPFGGYGVADSDYNRYNFKVHDYFLAKSIDKVKPNGIVAIVTSKGTMDKLNPSARKYVAERAELLGAIRLPNTAFKQTAGTEAVADILFFRKYANKINVDAENTEWLSTGKTAEGYEINQYFINHPEMVLGTLAEEHGLYGAIDVTVKPDGRELSSALNEAIENLPQAFYVTPDIPPDADEMTEADYAVKPLCYKADGGRLYMRVGEEMIEQPIPKTPKDAYQRIRGMIALREELHHILDIQIQGCSDETLQHEQAQLNAMYDRFTRQYGNLNSQTNVRLFKEDGDSALLFACEDVDKETKEIRKSDVFTKRTIRPYVVPTSTDDPFEALQISKNERGGVDISYIEELTGKDYETVLTELGDSVFRDPEKANKEDKYSGFVTSEEYLSGQVVTKLRAAKEYAADFPEYQRNVAALEQVQPARITASEISVRLGASWIDKEYYKQFYLELIDAPRYYEDEAEMFYNPHDSSWRLDQSDRIRTYTQMNQRKVYGTGRAPAYRLFVDAMNLKTVTIYDTIEEDGREKRVINQAETIAAREKQNKIKEAFADWIFKDPERREELENTYNRLFNRIRLPKYDGSYLKFPEMNPAIELRPHQKDAVHRIIISDGSTLLHHVVGSGKTYTGIAAIMKMRQLGLCKKAMVPVPNHLVQQWANDWRKLYPNAHILVATKEDLEKDNRQKFVSKVALGDWDGIIIAQSSFAKINISPERQIAKLQEEIRNVELTIERQWEENGKPRGAVKNLEQIKKSKQVQLKKLMADEKKDNVLTFESLGVDYLFVDEAHYYKNLFLFSKMNNVAGIPNAASQRATDLKLKCEYLQELHGSDRGAIFATGTPISNSMTEMYTMQSYLQPTVLKELGLNFFDAWAADFGETTTSMELTPSGQGYRARTRFSRFTNLPELQTLYRSFADVQTADMVRLDVPEAEKKVITLKPSDTIVELAESIAARADKIYNGGVDSSVDNMLKVTSDGKKLALDPRCFVPTSADEEGSKLNECARRIYEIWEDTAEQKSTQIVFCDLSTPKNKFEDYIYGQDFDVYNDLKYKLVQKGIPAEEIAFIHDATTDESKQALFDKINSGKVRVIMGSTEKCGAGTNVQKRLIALHHLDAPYRPSDMEQREGRIIRQGNTNRKVQIYTYVTERTFDSYSYQILENKQRFISQICKGNFTARAFEDMDETTLSYAEIKALTAANPKIKRKMEVDTEILRLRVLEGQYKKNKYELEDKIRKGYPEEIRQQELLIERVTEDLARFKENKPQTPEAFVINVDGKVYTDKKEGGKALTDALYKSKTGTDVAEYCGFKVCMNPISLLSNEREITLSAQGQYVINIGESASGNLTRIDNFLEDFPDRKERLEKKLQQLKNNMAIAQEQVVKQFEHAEQLSLLLSEQAELNAELNLDKREEVVIGDESDGDEEEHYRALPTQKEVEIIDKEDKVAAMETEVLPDYTVTQTDMHKYGYTWDGMLPLSRAMALRLWGMGLEVHKLFPNDTEIIVEDYGEMNPHEMNLYGIEKPVWKNFLNNEKSAAYLTARQHVASAAWNTVTEEMTDVEEGVKGKFSDECFRERAALENYLPHKNPPENEELKNCLPQVLEEFTQRLWDDDLQYYGWTETDVYQSIVGHLPNELQGVTMEQNKEIDYEKEVVESVKAEFEEYKQNLLGKSPEDIFYDNYKIHVFTELKDILSEGTGNGEYNGYLSKEHYRALYEERGGILGGLYDDFIGDEFASVNSGTDTAEFIKSYCEHYHADVMYPAVYYGKDTGNTAYYQFQRALSLDTLPDITERADSYIVAAPNSFISKDDLEKKNIFFLKIGRDITEDELKDTETAISNMQTAAHKVVKARRDEYIAVLNLHTECRNDIDKAISENYDGMHLKQGFEDELIAKYGVGEINYVLANTVQYFYDDGRISRDNKEWANEIEVTENEGHRYQFASNTHRAILDEFVNRMRKKQREILHGNKREEYYSVMKDTVNGKVEYTPVYVDANTGEIGSLFNRSFDTENEIDELIAKVNTATDVPREYRLVYVTPEELRIKSDAIKKTNAVKSLQGAYLNETKQGFKVVNITKDEYERNIAILYRQNVNDYIVAARYDTSDGTWAQGEYLSSLEEAEQYRRDKYGDRPYFYENKEGKKLAENEKNKWVEIYVSKDAVIKKYDKSTFMRMPATNREYSEYTYNIYNNRIKESRQIVDAQGDERELCYKISLKENETVLLKTRDGDEAELTAQEFRELVNHTFDKDYERKQSGNRVRIDLPQEAIIKEYDKTTLMMMPTSSKYQGYSYYLPNSVIHENTEKEDGSIYASLGEDFTVTLKKDKEEIKLTAKEYADLVNGKTADSYKRTPTAMDEYREQESGDDWKTVEISENAVIANYEKSVLLKMPKGQYEGLVYYLPNGMVRKEEDELVLRIPVDFEVHLKDGANGKTVDITAEEFIVELFGKTDKDYENIYRRPSEEAVKRFERVEEKLRKNAPEEMLNKPNWVVVRTRENNDTGRLDKFLIDVHTGKFAESDNPETWTDFDTACKYAKENGGVALAYALDGKDGIACIDLDGCMQENGDFSETANDVFDAVHGSYTEKSISGKGLHIFGKTKGADLRSFSKDKTMEYYQGGHFIAMTGDYYGSSELKSFDTPEMKSLLESKLEKRTEWKNTGKGIEGLSSMDDREMLDKAFSAKNGDMVKRLYNGEDIRHNRSNSDMSLMNYLAFWSNHDIDQMLRVFSTSGLYRPDKPQSYYEHTAIKAVKGTPCYTPPKASSNKPSGSGNSSGKGGK